MNEHNRNTPTSVGKISFGLQLLFDKYGTPPPAWGR